MEFLGIGPLEFLLILVIAIVILRRRGLVRNFFVPLRPLMPGEQ
jgi:hypothetical protein